MRIGDVIKQKRIECHLTQEELAQKIGTTKATVSRWESGDIKKIKGKFAEKLSEVFQMDILSLMTGEMVLFADEYEVISKYREASPGIRASVRKLLDIEGDYV